MPSLYSRFPNPDDVLALPVETLAAILLQMALAHRQGAGFVPASVTQPDTLEIVDGRDYQHPKSQQVARHVNSAWNWLERNGYIESVGDINGLNGWRDFTANGLAVAQGQDMQRLADAASFPKALLHPTIRDKVWNAIVRSTNATSQNELSDAVGYAFVTVEDAVRVACGYEAKDFGDNLIKRAVDPDTGPLGDRDTTKQTKEQLGLQTLFLGALAAYRNPDSNLQPAE